MDRIYGTVKPDPHRFSTNKRLKAKTGVSFGTAVLKAKGNKTVRPGDANTTSAKTVAASLTTLQQTNARYTAALNKQADMRDALGRMVTKEARTGVINIDGAGLTALKALRKFTKGGAT